MEQQASKLAKFSKLWIYYLLQSCLAVAVLLTLFLFLGEDRMVLISAMGATAFIVFAMPSTASAQPKVVIYSHFVGLLAGAIFAFTALPYYVECPLAAGIAIFIMVAVDVEHPPAAGTAIAAVINDGSIDVFVAVMASAVAMSLCRHFLKNHLRNLI